MNARIFWKLFVSALVFAWSVYYLVPLRDTPLPDYLLAQVTANKDQFQKILTEAQKDVAQAEAMDAKMQADKKAAKDAGQTYTPDPDQQKFVNGHLSLLIALKTMGVDQNLDYLEFFPNLAAGDIKNIPRRNDVILTYLQKESKGRLKFGLDLQGGVSMTFSVNPKTPLPDTSVERAAAMQKVVDILTSRLNGSGVSEVVVRPVGVNSVKVDIPGISSSELVDNLIKPAKLEFRLVNRTQDPSTTPRNQTPMGYEIKNVESEDPQTGQIKETPTFVSIRPAAGGDIIKSASVGMDQSGQYQVNMNFTSDGSKVFGDLTQKIVDEDSKPPYSNLADNDPFRHGRIAILLDGKLYSAPAVLGVISDRGQITGSFSPREAAELANVLNNPLAYELTVDEIDNVGPTLAADAKTSSIKAAVLGSALVVAFMLMVYRFAGFLSIITLALHMLVIIGIQSSIGVTLTLPGVAALVLTVGMAVDANILIYERMREELEAGKNLLSALEAGYSRALASIIDSNFTTLITAGILIWLGTGPIKGFGLILAIGLLSNLLCVLVFNQALLELVINTGVVKKMKFLRLIPKTSISFLGARKIAMAVSLCVIAVGVGAIFWRGNAALGIDFRGGDEVTATFAQQIPIGDIEKTAHNMGLSEAVADYQTEIGTGQQELKFQTEAKRGGDLLAALQQFYPQAKLQLLGTNQIGPAVSSGLKWNALWSLVLALLGVMVYVAFRFELGYAVGAIVATLHDVIITVGVFVLLGGQFSAPMVAAVLMIIGYSLNDKVIVFDRVREELKLNPQLKLVQVLDLAVNRTLSRTTLTSLTTFLASTSLYVFGAGVVSDFALVFMIGIVTGTLSSIFIANPVFFWWHKGDRRHVEAHEFLPKYEWERSTRASQ